MSRQLKNIFATMLVASVWWLGQTSLADVTGGILGTVKDPSGAAVPGGMVMLRNPSTGLSRQVSADASGSFEFLAVPVGEDYVVEVEAKGFRRSVQSGIKLLVNQRYRAEFQLQLGELSQTVTVTGENVQVESTNTQLGDVIEDKKMTSLPLNGRSYIDLLGLQAGVVPVQAAALPGPSHSVSGNGFNGALSVNGSREQANAFTVNGGDVEESTLNGASIVPSLDSIQEFRLLTNSFDAEYGRFSGAIVNVITKNGTNEFHGTAYEFLRNDKLDARNFFDQNQSDPATGQEIPNSARGAFKRNQFGGALGGPILKDRLFFFADYQGTRQVRGQSSGVVLVPSPTNRNGDFSDAGVTGYPELTGIVRGDAVPGNHTMDEVLSERLGYTVTSGEPYWTPGCNTSADALTGRCVFPGQAIPQSAWSPAAKGTMQFIPNPTGLRSGTPYFSTSALTGRVRDDKFAGRIDFSNHRTGNWAFYYHFDDARVVNPNAGGNVPGFPSTTPTRAQQINLSNTRIFGPSMVNDWRLNYTRSALRLGKAEGAGLGKISDFGFVEGGLGIIPSVPDLEGVPRIEFDALGLGFGVPSSTWQFNNTYQVSDNFSKIVGNHTLKFGADFRQFQVNMRWRYEMNGTFGFAGQETGNDFADYLLGAPDSFIQASAADLDARSKYFGVYAQDSYKLRPNLTLNYGLRWEFSQPWSDKYNRLQAFVPGKQSQRFPDSPLGWVFSGDPGIPPSLGPTDYLNFGPRLGIAYSPGFSDGAFGKLFGGPGKTSIRAAFGIYYTPFEQIQNNYELGNPPFAQYYLTPTQIYLEEPFKDRRRGNDPGQRFPYVTPPEGTGGIWQKFQPVASVPGFVTDNVLPYSMHFNLTVQRQLGNSTTLSLGYIGTRGHHLLSQQAANPGDRSRCLEIASILKAQGRESEACGPFGQDAIYDLGGGSTAYGTRPYSVTSGRYIDQGVLDFGDFTLMTTWGNSNYNAMQITVDKRVGSLRLLTAYTWSKSIDTGSGFGDIYLNPYDHRLSKELSAFDATHNFVVSYSYDLPFQKLFGSSHGGARRLLEGWQISGITRFTTGFPVLFGDGSDPSLCGCDGGGVDFPDYNGQPIRIYNPRDNPDHRYFSAEQFSRTALGNIGSANPRFFHGPGLNNWDLALQKVTRITEKTSIEFRAELFNAFNHAQFFTPDGDFNSGSFGLVNNARDPRIGQMAIKIRF